MDMSTISSKMLQKRYENLEDMVADFVQMFDNACKYNEPESLIYKVCTRSLIYKVCTRITQNHLNIYKVCPRVTHIQAMN